MLKLSDKWKKEIKAENEHHTNCEKVVKFRHQEFYYNLASSLVYGLM